MLLRSSSTPVLGSLLPSFSDSPSSNYHHQSELQGSTHKHTPNSLHSKLSCTNGEPQDYTKSSFHSPTGFRRVQSESNLIGFADDFYDVDKFSLSKKPLNGDDSDEEEIEERDEVSRLDYSYNSVRAENLALEQVINSVEGCGSVIFEGEGKMYLATGLGVSSIDFGDGGGGESYGPVAFGGEGGDSMEQHYKRLVEENPDNPLFLRNYAHFLYQVKGDLGAAEEYYWRAILEDPKDGEILSQYAKLRWELHRDKEGAANYFERAVEASSEDSHTHAAYASFLWDTEDDEDEENASRASQPLESCMASATA